MRTKTLFGLAVAVVFAVISTRIHASFVLETTVSTAAATSAEYFITSPTGLEFELPGASGLSGGWVASIINPTYLLLTGGTATEMFPDLHVAGDTLPSFIEVKALFWDGAPLTGTLQRSTVEQFSEGISIYASAASCPAASEVCNADYVDSFDRSSVPEPATLALFGLGLAGLGAARRKKQEVTNLTPALARHVRRVESNLSTRNFSFVRQRGNDMKFRGLGRLAIVLASAWAFAAESYAGLLILEPRSFSPIEVDLTATETAPGSANPSRTLTFAKFDPTLGTLTGLGIGFISAIEWDVSVDADSLGAASGFGGAARLDIDLDLFVDGIGHFLSLSRFSSAACSGVSSESCSNTTIDSDTFGSFGHTSDATLLANFVSFGVDTSFDIDVFTDLELAITACSGANAAGASIEVICSADASFLWSQYLDAETLRPHFVVSYEYEEANVPEPATLALFGLGLAGIGAVRRKKLAA